MSLEKSISVDLIEVLEDGTVQVRTRTSILENGKKISSIFHRHVITDGDDYSGEDPRVQMICSVVRSFDEAGRYHPIKS